MTGPGGRSPDDTGKSRGNRGTEEDAQALEAATAVSRAAAAGRARETVRACPPSILAAAALAGAAGAAEDCYFWYQARTDDMIISTGYNIAGPEVVAVLREHPKVLECSVVGVPDSAHGRIVKASWW